MAAGRFLWVAVAAFLASGCVAQETQAAAGLSQERVRELFSLAAEAGLDVSGVASEDELLRMIASHPPAMQALRARIARENAEADEGGGEAPGEDDGIQIVDLDEEEDDDAARGQAYTQSLFGHSAFRQPEDRAATDEGDAGGARGYAHGGQAQEEGHEAAADEGSAGAPGDAHKPASDEEWEEDADADDADAGPSEHVPEVRAQSTGTKASGEQRPAGGDETELRVLESATTKLFTVADSDDDLQLTPRGLLDGIAAYGQLLLTTHGCALPPGTALTMRQLSDGVRALFEACDTDGDGLLSLLEAQADSCRAHLLGLMAQLGCTGERAAPPAKGSRPPWVALVGAQKRLAARALGACTAIARGAMAKALGAMEGSSPLGRSLVSRLRAVRCEDALPRLRTYALWLSVALAFALCGTASSSGEELYPQFAADAGSGGQDAADAVWVDDD